MADWQPDLLMSGFPWLEKSGALSAEIVISDAASFTHECADTDTLTYDLLGPDGVSVLSAPATATKVSSAPGQTRFRATPTPTAALSVGQVYREVWTGTVNVSNNAGGAVPGSSGTIRAMRDAYPTRYAQRYAPITSSMLAYDTPMLLTAPSVVGSWRPQIERGWYELCAWLVRQRAGDLWTPSELAVPCEHIARHYVWRSMAALGSASALLHAANERTAYEVALKAVQLGWDSDGDGDIDAVKGPAGSATDGGVVA